MVGAGFETEPGLGHPFLGLGRNLRRQKGQRPLEGQAFRVVEACLRAEVIPLLVDHLDKGRRAVETLAGRALRIEVGRPEWQAERIRIAIRNLTATRLIVDEIGYNNDVDQIASCADLGVGVFCTLHGDGLRDAVNNALYAKLFGIHNGQRTGKRVSFRMCLELLDPDRWVLYPDLAESVDDLSAGRAPRGIRLGSGW